MNLTSNYKSQLTNIRYAIEKDMDIILKKNSPDGLSLILNEPVFLDPKQYIIEVVDYVTIIVMNSETGNTSRYWTQVISLDTMDELLTEMKNSVSRKLKIEDIISS